MRWCVRTTLTLDDDVAVALERLRRRRREPLKQVVNAVLRAGLSALDARATAPRKPFRTQPMSLGPPRLKNLDNISDVLAFAEGEDFR